MKAEGGGKGKGLEPGAEGSEGKHGPSKLKFGSAFAYGISCYLFT